MAVKVGALDAKLILESSGMVGVPGGGALEQQRPYFACSRACQSVPGRAHGRARACQGGGKGVQGLTPRASA